MNAVDTASKAGYGGVSGTGTAAPTENPMSQDELFRDFARDLEERKGTDENIDAQMLRAILKDRATLKRLNAMIKKIELRVDSNEDEFLEVHKKNGTFVMGSFTYTIESKMPDCRPKWKDEFIALAMECKLNATVYVNKIVEKTRSALQPKRTITVKNLTGSK